MASRSEVPESKNCTRVIMTLFPCCSYSNWHLSFRKQIEILISIAVGKRHVEAELTFNGVMNSYKSSNHTDLFVARSDFKIIQIQKKNNLRIYITCIDWYIFREIKVMIKIKCQISSCVAN